MKSSTQQSRSQAIAMAVTESPILTTVRQALQLSKYHSRPSRRATARSAKIPETKSTPMKSSVVMTSG